MQLSWFVSGADGRAESAPGGAIKFTDVHVIEKRCREAHVSSIKPCREPRSRLELRPSTDVFRAELITGPVWNRWSTLIVETDWLSAGLKLPTAHMPTSPAPRAGPPLPHPWCASAHPAFRAPSEPCSHANLSLMDTPGRPGTHPTISVPRPLPCTDDPSSAEEVWGHREGRSALSRHCSQAVVRGHRAMVP